MGDEVSVEMLVEIRSHQICSTWKRGVRNGEECESASVEPDKGVIFKSLNQAKVTLLRPDPLPPIVSLIPAVFILDEVQ